MKGIAPETPVYLGLGVTDMRAGFERLSAVVQERMSRSVTSGGLYVFFSRCRRRVKIHSSDNDGYALWYKRLEAGTFRVEVGDGMENIIGIDLEQLLSGIDRARIILKRHVEQGLYAAP
jgi:transposase